MNIRFTFLHSGESAIARMRLHDAPMTCKALWNALPVAGVCHHASYSGSEGVLILPKPMRLPPENATHEVEPGDIGFTWFAPGDAYGVTQEFAEVCWFYDRDARPSMHEGPAPVNLFARFDGDASAFYARSRAMRRSGVTGLLIERLGGPEAREPIAYHDPGGEAPLAARPAAVAGRLLSVMSEASRCMVAESDDGGANWSAVAELGTGTCGNVAVGLKTDGTNVVSAETVWAAIGSEGEGPIRLAMRDPQSAIWGAARDTGLVGSGPSVAVMPDGDLLILYRSSCGLAGARSDDGGVAWRDMRIAAAPEAAQGPLALPCLDGRLLCAFRLEHRGPRNCLTAVVS